MRKFLAGVVVLAGASFSHAAFEDPFWSARAAALGGAFTALTEDAALAHYNPAAATYMEERAVQFSYAKLFSGVDNVNVTMNQMAYVQPLRSFNVMTLSWATVDTVEVLREQSLGIGLAHLFREVPGFRQAALGVSARLLTQSFVLDQRTVNDPVFQDGRRKSAVALDVHGYSQELETLAGTLSVGFSARSLNRPNVGFREDQKLPVETALGVAYRWGRMTVPLDLVQRKKSLTPHLGFEAVLPNDHLLLRTGSDTHQIGAGFGYRWTTGIKSSWQIDYAFLWPLDINGTSGSHRVTVGARF